LRRKIDLVGITPAAAGLRLIWILFNLILGAVGGGILAWGPLNGERQVILLLGVLGGLLGGGLWAWQLILLHWGKAGSARCWARALILVQAGIALVVFTNAVWQLYRVGALQPVGQDRASNFEHLWNAINDHYPYFDLKDVDWNEVYERYYPQVKAARDDVEYHAIVERMLAELEDAHTNLVWSPLEEPGCGFAFTQEIEGVAVVTVAGQSAQNAGLGVGALISQVDGMPLEQALSQVDPWLRAGSTPWQQRAWAFENLLNTPAGDSRTVTFTQLNGEQLTATLTCPEDPSQLPSGELEIWELVQPRFTSEIYSQRMLSGFGYIRIPTFGDNLVDEFNLALNELLDTPGLVLDLRGNGGGNTRYAFAMAGRFLDEAFSIGRDHFRNRLPQRGWRLWLDMRVDPRKPVYTGEVVLLIDTGCMSTTEQFILAFVDSGRAQVVGRRSAGATGNPIQFHLVGGGRARFSTGDFYRQDGTRLEGVGIIPDVVIDWTLDDFYQDRDPDLEAAETLLNK
jgi:carboxyl-terminal processing protease